MSISSKIRNSLLASVAAVACLTSCNMMHENRDDCPMGLYIKFKYDYNLQRADMFNAHVGEVTLYIFDEDGNFVKSQTEANLGESRPLESPYYTMHVTDLAPGRYNFVALAGQNPYAEQLISPRSTFRRVVEPGVDTRKLTDLEILLDRTAVGTHADGKTIYEVSAPTERLDTLWHGIDLRKIEVSDLHATYDTISLVRDTKQIHISLREIDNPQLMDINNYDLQIVDRNTNILYDNSLNEDHYVVYHPHTLWNSDDRALAPEGSRGDDTESNVGHIGHADFMTSRILYHPNAMDDGQLRIVHKDTGAEVAVVNLPDMLSRIANYDDLHRYTRQEFLDRCYDYNLDFYLKGDRLKYVNINISVLSWSLRIQFEDL